MIRDEIKAAQIAAMKARDTATLNAARLIQAAIKNRDIELRTSSVQPDDDVLVTEVMQKMIKQRRESIELYVKGGRQELADAELAEVAVIERFLPQQMSEDDATLAVNAIATELGATSVKDMGRVMAAVKERHAGQIDMSKASALVKARLS
ncbi:MAG TPA: GatB/YqeY domain-containing protein [Sphingomonas sp.]|nr:GatB/YqeY domain-containing protein [Sphingomonas sp.]